MGVAPIPICVVSFQLYTISAQARALRRYMVRCIKELLGLLGIAVDFRQNHNELCPDARLGLKIYTTMMFLDCLEAN